MGKKIPSKLSIYVREEVRKMVRSYKVILQQMGVSLSELQNEIIKALVENVRKEKINPINLSRVSFGVYMSRGEGVEKVTVKME